MEREDEIDGILAELRMQLLSAVGFNRTAMRPTIRTGYELDHDGERCPRIAPGPVSVYVFTITHV